VKTFDQPEVKAEILQRLAALEPNSARVWGKMTSHQAICHWRDSLRAALGERSMTVPPSSGLQKMVMKYGALYFPMPWPRGVKTSLEADQELQGTPPADFARDKNELLELAERIAAHQVRWIESHGIFGSLNEREWQRWTYLHFDHHLRQFGL
jgi:Protein of unknown function (DUF1569)